MKTRSTTRFRTTKQKYIRLHQRIQRLIATGEIRKYTYRKRQQLLKRLARYRRQAYRLAGAAAIAGAIMLPMQAQVFCPFTNPNNPFEGIDVGGYSNPQLVDVDGDGDLDLISGESLGTILYFENDGNGNYTQQTGSNNPFNGIDVGEKSNPYLADVDGDGDLDLISGENFGTILYFENDGNGNYTQQTGSNNPFDGIDVGINSNPQLVDLDSDGDLDLIIGEFFGTIFYFENDGSGNYTEQTGSNNPFDGIDVGTLSTPQLIDMDGDGDLDLISGEDDGIILYFENDGSGNYTEQTGSNNPFDGIDVGTFSTPQLVDLDGDGDLDLISGEDSGTILYFENDGNGNYKPPINPNNPFSGIDVGSQSAPQLVDVDGDGDLDLISGEIFGDIFYFENDGCEYTEQTGSNNPFDGIDIGNTRSTPQLIDMDGDGDLDLISGGNFGIIRYFENDGNGNYTQQTGSNNPFDGIDVGINSNPQLVDLDSDGDLDLLSGKGSGTILYFENDGNGNYIRQNGGDNPFNGIDVGAFASPQLADVDMDGDLDLIVGELSGTIRYYKKIGLGYSLQTGSSNPFDGIDVGGYSNPQLVDVDGDGDLDLIVGDTYGTFSYFENAPDCSPVSDNSYVSCANDPFDAIDVGAFASPQLADVDMDGDLDLISGNNYGKILYYENDGTDTFIEQTSTNNPFSGIDVGNDSAPHLADLDGDGDLDLLIGDQSGNILYYENIGGNYVQQTGGNNPFKNVSTNGASSPHLADVDMDGDLDLLVGEIYGKVLYYRNDAGTFNQQTGANNPFNGVNIGGFGSSFPYLADVDEDGDLDLIVSSYAGDIQFHENIGGTYTQQTGANNPFDGLDLGAYIAAQVVDLDNDGDLDVIAGNSDGNILYYENINLSVVASTDNCATDSGEVEIQINSAEITGAYNITGDFDGTVCRIGTRGGRATIVTGITSAGTYNVLVTTEEGCSLPVEVVIDADCAQKPIDILPKVFLQGPLNGANMNAELGSGLIPTSEPYTTLGYSFVGGGNENTSTAVLNTTGSTAIVDWVIVELRDAVMPNTIIESRAALIRADGMVVDTDGSSPVRFNTAVGNNYHVAVKHRNHLGVMTGAAIGF